MIHAKVADCYFVLSKNEVATKPQRVSSMSKDEYKKKRHAITKADFIETLNFVLSTFKK